MDKIGYIKRYMPVWKDWKLDKFLGSGSYGNVWQVVRVTNKTNNKSVNQENASLDKQELHTPSSTVAAIKEIVVPPTTAGTIESACLQGLDIENAKLYFADALKKTVAEAAMQQELSDCRNIVRFWDYQVRNLDQKGEFGWVCYILMDKVEVFPKYLMKNGIKFADLIRLGVDLCCALERCKEAGIVHRDVKPENIFYCSQENCFQLGDFGIAQYLRRSTESKGRPGTLTHMSPEVYKGEEFGYEDDLYAVGMILYKLLNYNRIPLLPDYPLQYFPKDRNEALFNRLKGASLPLPALININISDIPKVNQIGGGIRLLEADYCHLKNLGEIAHKAINPNKNLRYKSAVELRKALEHING